MRRIPLFATYLIALGLTATPVSAQVADQLAADVKIRGGSHDGYTRIVFDWPKTPKYSAEQSAGALTLKFNETARFTISGASPETLQRVSAFSTTATGAQIGFADGKSVRHFVIGSRVIVDIKDNGAKTAQPVKDAAPKKETAAAPQTKPAEPKPAAPAAPAAEPAKETPATPPQAAETTGTAKPASPLAAAPGAFGAHMINVTSTQATGIAVFERFGNLWIVIDEADFALMPQITGPQKDKFAPFERFPLKDGTAFRMPMPEGLKAYGEGGGLVWKVALTPTPRKIERLHFKREFDPAQKPGGKLVWDSAMTRRVLDLPDPDAGDIIKVVTVSGAGDYAGEPQSFVEIGTLASRVGLAFATRVDDLEVTRSDKGVVIARPGGLSLSADSDIASLRMRESEPEIEPEPEEDKPLGAPNKDDEAAAVAAGTPTDKQPDAKSLPPPSGSFTRIFAFDRWLMGGLPAIRENQRVIMSALHAKTDQGKAEDLITLGKMELANGRGPESLGYLEFAVQLVPDLATNPEFLALHGAAQALLGQYDRAFRDFSAKSLDNITEIKYWRAYCLAELEDWKQAEEVMPKDTSLLGQYPEGVRIPLALTLSEVALRSGDAQLADTILGLLERSSDTMSLAHNSAYRYMRGESSRQQGKFEDMGEDWEALASGKDDLYRAKAGLALTAHRLEKKEMPLDKAIDTLEGLRYAWRGDELETAINYKLGRIYMDNGQPIKGLTLLRQAASLAPGSDLGKQITAYMTDTFKNIYLTGKLNELNPIDAVTIYDEFSELIPVGPEGDRIARQLAERLVDADLLPRAENLLQKQIGAKAEGLPAAEVALRLASIQILDGKAAKAVETLNRANEILLALPADAGADKRREVALLRARAMSDLKQPEEAFAALALLPQEPDVLRLRADIAWRSKRWQDAADTLEELVMKMGLADDKPMTATQADTVLNWAVALYLADNRYVLANLREKYADAMAQTQLAKKFEVVTRPRQNALLADRNTINTIIGETDIFKGFLNGFNSTTPAKP